MGSLAAQLGRATAAAAAAASPAAPQRAARRPPVAGSPPPGGDEALLFDNGLGGFTADGREYVITVRGGAATAGPLEQRARQPRASAAWSPRPAAAIPGRATAR